ncbi:MAG: hypothetical protein EBV82_02965 [Chitinophagia bacterium]|jgi:hypothetical protein|nr:hypothetical protein [Chitinophagia bacterium]
MSQEKTILPNPLLVSLYKDTLVLPELSKKKVEINEKRIEKLEEKKIEEREPIAGAAEMMATNDTSFKYLGEHLQGVTVIVKDDLAVYLNETDLNLLTSILKACKLTLADIALVNVAQQKLSLHQILATLPAKLVIIFEVSGTELKMKLPTTLYKSVQLGDTYLLFSNSLASMQGTDQLAKVEKSKLWNVLKQLFQL